MIERNELLDLVVCPACRGALRSFASCAQCGASFSEIDGTPALFPTSATRTVQVQFDQNRSVKGERFQNCFVYPLRRGAALGDYPYHLDLAHLDVFDQLPKNSIILDIGCGGGQMRQFLQMRGHRYVGVDLSKTRVDKNLQQHGGPDLLCDAHFLPIAEEAFDLVYSVNLSEHVACPYLIAQEAARILKPGGFYLGTGAFLQPWHDDSFFHMSPLGVFEFLTQAKFEIMNIWPGQGYSGFRAIMAMGSKATRPLTFLGDFMYFIYRTGNKFRNLVKRRPDWRTESIADAARVSGAIDWIARRPSGRLDAAEIPSGAQLQERSAPLPIKSVT